MPEHHKPAVTVREYEVTPVDALREHPENPRRGTVSLITESIRTHGQYRPIVAQRSTGHILAGNHTYRAAIEAGMTEIAVSWIDCDDAEARRILLVDNRVSDLGVYDDERLLDLLRETEEEYGDLRGTGYDVATMDDLVAMFERPEVTAPPSPMTEPPTGGDHEALAHEYADRAQRLIILRIPQAAYEWTVEGLEAIARAQGQPGATYTDTIQQMLRDAEEARG